jgi:hypothetical protein
MPGVPSRTRRAQLKASGDRAKALARQAFAQRPQIARTGPRQAPSQERLGNLLGGGHPMASWRDPRATGTRFR